MKVNHISKKIIYHMDVDDEEYIRYSADMWCGTMYFDIISEDYDVGEELSLKLEKLFQEYKDFID